MINKIILDIDGTLTDGKIYMGQNGELMKAFSVKDGYAISHILKPKGIVPVVITARQSNIVLERCKELGITQVYQGEYDKLRVMQTEIGDDLSGCAYFGDDVPDIQCMLAIKEAGGIVACPADAVKDVKIIADYICSNEAGRGALREFSEWLVSSKEYDTDIDKRIKNAIGYLQGLKIDDTKVGQYQVDEGFYYRIHCYQTRPENDCEFESHKRYVDIQYIVKGEEAVDICDISRLKIKRKYDIERDVTIWNEPQQFSRVTLSENNYLILYPEYAHRGGVLSNQESQVVKVVAKIKCMDS